MSCDQMKTFYFQFCKTFPQDLHKPKAFGGITKPQMKEPLGGAIISMVCGDLVFDWAIFQIIEIV